MRSRRSPAERGFSLLEVTVALGILAALTAVAGVAFAPARDRFRLAAETRELALWLEQARGRALTRAEPILIRFDVAASRLVAGTAEGADDAPGPVVASGLSFDGIDPCGGPVLTFWPDGGATDAVLRIGEGARAARITVEALTGRVRVAQGAGGEGAGGGR